MTEKYLATVEERDVDLLLIEELHVSDDFVKKFCASVGLFVAVFEGAWHSVSNADGETDILLVVMTSEKRVAILVENKVNAPEQDRQDERYHVRGERYVKDGRCDEYRTIICAPQRYLDALPSQSKYQFRVSYEEIATWFCGSEDRRTLWRKSVILQAIDRGRRGYVTQTDDAITSFQQEYWKHLAQEHPRIHMNRPTNKGPGSTWISLKGEGFPTRVHLVHKMDQDIVELSFQGQNIQDLKLRSSDLHDDIVMAQKGKTVALSVRVPEVDPREEFSSQLAAVEAALAAAYRLITYRSALPDPRGLD